jgi:septum formation protein
MAGKVGTGFPSAIAAKRERMARIVLASASPTRIAVLRNAGLDVTVTPARIDERAVEAPLVASARPPADIAAALAEAKALSVAAGEAGAFVIGADQVLSADGRPWHKPGGMAEARNQLAALSGRTHELHSAIAVVRDGSVAWRHGESVRMTMRPLAADFIDDYLVRVGEAALGSVGAYQIEGPGIQLFDRIEGDYFAILGLPLLPLLGYLRKAGAIQ